MKQSTKRKLKQYFRRFWSKQFNRLMVQFIALMLCFYVIWIMPFFQDTIVANVAKGYASISAFSLNVFGNSVQAIDDVLSSSQFTMSIKNGCDAIEAIAILLCAMIIYPTSYKNKMVGLVLGSLLLIILNIIRIISLFFVGIYVPSIFDVMHISVWQIIFIIVPMLIVMQWLNWIQLKPTNEPAQTN